MIVQSEAQLLQAKRKRPSRAGMTHIDNVIVGDGGALRPATALVSVPSDPPFTLRGWAVDGETRSTLSGAGVEFCLRIGKAGYRIVYLPYVELRHYESKSRGYDVNDEQQDHNQHERLLMQRKWNIATYVDSYYNPESHTGTEDFSIAP